MYPEGSFWAFAQLPFARGHVWYGNASHGGIGAGTDLYKNLNPMIMDQEPHDQHAESWTTS